MGFLAHLVLAGGLVPFLFCSARLCVFLLFCVICVSLVCGAYGFLFVVGFGSHLVFARVVPLLLCVGLVSICVWAGLVSTFPVVGYSAPVSVQCWISFCVLAGIASPLVFGRSLYTILFVMQGRRGVVQQSFDMPLF